MGKQLAVPAIGHNNLSNLTSEFKETYIHTPKKRSDSGKSCFFCDLFFWGGGLRIFIFVDCGPLFYDMRVPKWQNPPVGTSLKALELGPLGCSVKRPVSRHPEPLPFGGSANGATD